MLALQAENQEKLNQIRARDAQIEIIKENLVELQLKSQNLETLSTQQKAQLDSLQQKCSDNAEHQGQMTPRPDFQKILEGEFLDKLNLESAVFGGIKTTQDKLLLVRDSVLSKLDRSSSSSDLEQTSRHKTKSNQNTRRKSSAQNKNKVLQLNAKKNLAVNYDNSGPASKPNNQKRRMSSINPSFQIDKNFIESKKQLL